MSQTNVDRGPLWRSSSVFRLSAPGRFRSDNFSHTKSRLSALRLRCLCLGLRFEHFGFRPEPPFGNNLEYVVRMVQKKK